MTTISGEAGAEYVNALLATCQNPRVSSCLHLRRFFEICFVFTSLPGLLWTRFDLDADAQDRHYPIGHRD